MKIDVNKSLIAFKKSLLKTRKENLKPQPNLNLVEWSEQYSYLDSSDSDISGRFRVSVAQYQKEIMEAISDRAIRKVVLMTGSQQGKTVILLNTVKYFIHQDPSPCLMVQPTTGTARDFAQTRIKPAFECTPVINEIIDVNKITKDGSNSLTKKTFPGGSLSIVGANSPSDLKSRPIKILLADEIDEWPADLDGQGDTLKFVENRTNNFPNSKKIVFVSTPTIKDESNVEREYTLSSQGKYHIKCIKCEDHFVPDFQHHVRWGKDEDNNAIPDSAHLHCPNCDYPHNSVERDKAVLNGKWIHTYPERKTKGFWTNALTSPWVKLGDLVEEFSQIHGNPNLLKVFRNQKLSHTWEPEYEGVQDIDYLSRRENYTGDSLPNGVQVITFGCDLQADRLEAVFIGYGKYNESWQIKREIIHGDPHSHEFWDDVEKMLSQQFQRNDGLTMGAAAGCLDSSYLPHLVHAFTKKHTKKRWYPVKGENSHNPYLPLFPDRSKYDTTNKTKYYRLGTHAGKLEIYAYLKAERDQDGYMHFNQSHDDDFFKQLTAEKLIKKKIGNKIVKVFDAQGRRNEIIDVTNYSLAAKYSLKIVNWDMLVKKNQRILDKQLEKQQAESESINITEKPKKKKRRGLKINGSGNPLFN